MVIATNNKNKLKEFKDMLNDKEIYSLNEKNIKIDIVEDGKTFLENAKKKATVIYNLVKEEVIADDSGLCIKSLNGFPGVETNRFLGNVSNHEKNEFLINKLDDFKDRSASFICNLVYYDGKKYFVGIGKLDGKIAKYERGDNGFGFDSIFELPDGRTLAELSSYEKNLISARNLALKDLISKLNN